jgi:hypothetical protein
VLGLAYGIANLAYGIIYHLTPLLSQKDLIPEIIAFGLLDILTPGTYLILAGIWHTAILLSISN